MSNPRAEAAAPRYIRYLPIQQGEEVSSNSKQRIIRMVEAQKDPMEPPKFKINQKIPRGPPSPPAPVMHSPPRKVTSEEQAAWKIPPLVSSWKNPKGYTIPLDKRCAVDGRSIIGSSQVNERFAQLSEALYMASSVAREQVEMRAQAERKIAQKEKEKKEEDLRLLAQKAREQRANGQRSALEGLENSDDDDDIQSSIDERNRIRNERSRDRVRDVNLQMVAPDRRSKLERQRERDISEQIALGVARPQTSDADFVDQRLYDQARGLSSGFGKEDDYTVYDQPWKSRNSLASTYRPSKEILDEIDEVRQAERQGEKRPAESRPVQFTKDEDPFGLTDFLKQARNSKKSDYEQKEDRSKRRRS